MRFWILVICSAIVLAALGCQEGKKLSRTPEQKKSTEQVVASYAPQSVEILGLSELKPNAQNQGVPHLRLFVAMQDAFGSAMKYPGVFRFELYEYVAKSPLPRGKRIEIWPDFDLMDATVNNVQFKDYLHAYEFELDVQAAIEGGKIYIIESTCVLPSGRRVSSQAHIKYE